MVQRWAELSRSRACAQGREGDGWRAALIRQTTAVRISRLGSGGRAECSRRRRRGGRGVVADQQRDAGRAWHDGRGGRDRARGGRGGEERLRRRGPAVPWRRTERTYVLDREPVRGGAQPWTRESDIRPVSTRTASASLGLRPILRPLGRTRLPSPAHPSRALRRGSSRPSWSRGRPRDPRGRARGRSRRPCSRRTARPGRRAPAVDVHRAGLQQRRQLVGAADVRVHTPAARP